MAGVPFHAVDGYLRKMIAAGHKVAICEQMEDAALAKGVVKRDVVRLMTPGTITDDPLLDGRRRQLPRRRRVRRHPLRRIPRRPGLGRTLHGQLRRDQRLEGQMLDELPACARRRCSCRSCPRASRTTCRGRSPSWA